MGVTMLKWLYSYIVNKAFVTRLLGLTQYENINNFVKNTLL